MEEMNTGGILWNTWHLVRKDSPQTTCPDKTGCWLFLTEMYRNI